MTAKRRRESHSIDIWIDRDDANSLFEEGAAYLHIGVATKEKPTNKTYFPDPMKFRLTLTRLHK